MRVSFFSLNLSPLPSALYHQEVPSLSSAQAVDLSCETSPPSSTSTPPVPSPLPRQVHCSCLSPLPQSQAQSYVILTKTPTPLQWQQHCPVLLLLSKSLFWNRPHPSSSYLIPLFKALCFWRPTCQSTFKSSHLHQAVCLPGAGAKPLAVQTSPRIHGHLPNLSWTLSWFASSFTHSASPLQLSCHSSTSWKCQWLCLLCSHNTRGLFVCSEAGRWLVLPKPHSALHPKSTAQTWGRTDLQKNVVSVSLCQGFVCLHACMLSHSAVSNSLGPHGL